MGEKKIETFLRLQGAQAEWQRRNFPDAEPHHCLLGLQEEVGELAHAHLKCEQGIRGSETKHFFDKQDAVGDILIFLAGYCNSNGLNMQECLDAAWSEVERRDWNKDKGTGVA